MDLDSPFYKKNINCIFGIEICEEYDIM